MKALLAMMILAAAAQDGPVYTATVKIDDVWGPSCIDTLEARLRKVDGIRVAKVKGFDRESKFFFNLAIDENKSVVPATIRRMLEELKKESKGDEDYPYNSMVIDSITGTVEKAGEKWMLVARGSKQKYELVPNDALKKLVDAGKVQVVVGGKVTDDQSILKLEISEAKEAAK